MKCLISVIIFASDLFFGFLPLFTCGYIIEACIAIRVLLAIERFQLEWYYPKCLTFIACKWIALTLKTNKINENVQYFSVINNKLS